MRKKLFEEIDFFPDKVNQNCKYCGKKILPGTEYCSKKCQKENSVWHKE